MISVQANRKKQRLSIHRCRAEQLRIRLLPSERAAIEQVRLQDLQAGHAYAVTQSSWIRYHLEPFLNCDANTQPYLISNELYGKVVGLARLLNKTPETVIEECVAGIDNLIRHSHAQRPLIVAEWRLRQQYRQIRKKD